MRNDAAAVELHFAVPLTDQTFPEAEARGFLSHVLVRVGAKHYAVTFYDPVRLAQDVATESEFGRPFVAIPGLIVLPQVTQDSMTTAVQALASEGFFNHLVPTDPASLAAGDPFRWPPPTGF